MTGPRCKLPTIGAMAIGLTVSVSSCAIAQAQATTRADSKIESVLIADGDLNGDRQRSYCTGILGDQNAGHQRSYVGMNEPDSHAAMYPDVAGKSAAPEGQKK